MFDARFPVESIKERLLAAARGGPVVLTAPTGSGKSTQVPRWLTSFGRVLVIEPRRVACRSLAQYVSQLERTKLGESVGYVVRDESRASSDASITFATPGVSLRWMAQNKLASFGAVVMDEFHERSMDVDLLLAMLLKRYKGLLVVMSATMGAARVASHIDGEHLHAAGRQFEVTVNYLADAEQLLPDERGLVSRVLRAIERVDSSQGDVLVFLPGKGEIKKTAEALKGIHDFDVLEMHGGLSLDEQRRAFETGARPKVVLATNVAETSITIPGIRVVIDTGLVRRTRYYAGRAYLCLMPVAMDSAEQRAGRAGRTAPGTCIRLWSEKARLEELTRPAVLREELDPLLLATVACGEQIDKLPFLDMPKDYAIASAKEHLGALGAIGPGGTITDRGRILFGLPLDAALGNILIEADKRDCIEDALDLVSGLAVGRPLFVSERHEGDGEEDPRSRGCDGLALISIVRGRGPVPRFVSGFARAEARILRAQLFRAWGISQMPDSNSKINRDSLLEAIVAADRRCAHIARRRKGRVSWAAGGTEVTLHLTSAVDERKVDAVVVLARIGLGPRHKKQALIATAAMPVRLEKLRDWALADPRVGKVYLEKGVVKSVLEYVYAGKIVATEDVVPTGALARSAFLQLILRGSLFSSSLALSKERIEEKLLYDELATRGLTEDGAPSASLDFAPGDDPLERWVARRLEQLGVEDGSDLGLMSSSDLLFKELEEWQTQWLKRNYPVRVNLGDVQYKAEYDFSGKSVTLVKVAGTRRDPPAKSALPGFSGFKIRVKHHSRVWVL